MLFGNIMWERLQIFKKANAAILFVLGKFSLTISSDNRSSFQNSYRKKIPQIKKCTVNSKYLITLSNNRLSA